MMPVLNKSHLVDELRAGLGVTIVEAERIVDIILGTIAKGLHRGETVEIRRFGTFSTRTRQPRLGRNPKTGQLVKVPAKRVAFFRPGKSIKAFLEGSAPE
jgi:nucleoid DNA-binding protein